MLCCHSASRRATIRASFSGCAAIPMLSPEGPGPILAHCRISVPCWRLNLESPTGGGPIGPDDIPHPAALILDLDDLAHRLPGTQCIVLAPPPEAGTNPNAVRTVEPSADCSSAEHRAGTVMSVT